LELWLVNEANRRIHFLVVQRKFSSNAGYRSLKVSDNDTIRQTAYDFIFTFYSNFGASLHRFSDMA